MFRIYQTATGVNYIFYHKNDLSNDSEKKSNFQRFEAELTPNTFLIFSKTFT